MLYIGEPPRHHHDEYALAVVDLPDPDLEVAVRQNTLNEVIQVISNPPHNFLVDWSSVHPFCVGVIRLANVLARDRLVSRPGVFNLAGGRVLFFIRQNEGRNVRRTEGLRVFYVMFLGWRLIIVKSGSFVRQFLVLVIR